MRKLGVVLGVFLSLASYAFKAQAAADALTFKWAVHVDGKPGDLADCIVDFSAIGEEAFGVVGGIALGVGTDKRIEMTIVLGVIRYDVTTGKEVKLFIGDGWIRAGDFSTEDERYDWACSSSKSLQIRCRVFRSAHVIETIWSAVLAGEFAVSFTTFENDGSGVLRREGEMPVRAPVTWRNGGADRARLLQCEQDVRNYTRTQGGN